MAKFEFNLSMDELEKRTNKDYLIKKKFLKAEIGRASCRERV